MAIADPCVSKMEERCFSVTTSSEPATLLFEYSFSYIPNTRQGHTGRLASLTPHRSFVYELIMGRQRQSHFST